MEIFRCQLQDVELGEFSDILVVNGNICHMVLEGISGIYTDGSDVLKNCLFDDCLKQNLQSTWYFQKYKTFFLFDIYINF